MEQEDWQPKPDDETPPTPIAWWMCRHGIFSSPNVLQIPSPPIDVPLISRLDGRYGKRELSRWPQFIDMEASIHHAWVQLPGEPHGDVGGNLSSFELQLHHLFPPDDAAEDRLASCVPELATNIANCAKKAIASAQYFMDRASSEPTKHRGVVHLLELVVEKLERHMLSKREMSEAVAEAQRHIAELNAYAHYREDIEKKWKSKVRYQATSVQACLGGYTTSPYLAQVLNILGVPVWLMHKNLDGLDPSRRSYDILHPHEYLELRLWPSDATYATTSSSAMPRDLSCIREYPASYVRVQEDLCRRPDGSQRPRARSCSPTRRNTQSSSSRAGRPSGCEFAPILAAI